MTGYKSKRAAAQDKLAQPAQEPVAVVSVNQSGAIRMAYLDGSAFDISKHIGQRFYTFPPQPAQEPVANDRALQLVTYQMNHWKAYALELQERLVKYEGGAPMILNKEKNT